ncbi:ATP-binding protein [Shewanella marina]|uniref:ATP-binding protein n=1 Tax=Shewanella marina TaxID=487319 RepID=UPI00046F5DE8|nr:ATP-binding protein [Shewanella marina]
MLFKIIIIIFITFIISSPSFSYHIEKPYAKNWDLETGLVGSSIYTIAEDPLNRIWVGSPNGISIIDGLGITNLTKNNSLEYSISSNVITKIINYKNEMWVLNLNGIDIINIYNLKPSSIKDNDKLLTRSNNITFINDEYALSVSNRKIIKINLSNHSVSKFSDDPRLQNTSIIYKIDNANILISTLSEYYQYNLQTNSIKKIKLQNFNKNEQDVRATKIDKNGQLWISIFGKGIFVYKNEQLIKKFNTKNNTLRSNMISSFITDNEYIYAVTRKGIEKFNIDNLIREYSIIPNSKNEKYNNADMALTANIHSNGSIFVGTTDGLYRIPNKKNHPNWQYIFNNKDDIHIKYTGTNENTLKVSTQNELHTFQFTDAIVTKKFESKKHNDTILSQDNNYYLSSSNKIIKIIKNNTSEILILNLPKKIRLISIHKIIDSNYFILTSSTELFLAKIKNNTLTIDKRRKTGIIMPVDSALINNKLIIATQRKGVVSIDINDFENTTIPLTMIDGPQIPITLYENKEKLWVITLDDGLYYLNKNDKTHRLHKYEIENKHNNFNPICMTEDQLGNIWIATSHGLSQLKNNKIISFDYTSGLNHQEFQRLNCGTINNYIYFSSLLNITYFKQPGIKSYNRNINVSFLSIKVDDNIYWNSKKNDFIEPSLITLKLTSSNFNITDDDNIFYRIKSKDDGIYSEWRLSDKEIKLIKPKPGRYIIEAKIIKYDGTESNIATKHFIVSEPFYRSTIMMICYFIILTSMISLIFYYKLKFKTSQLHIEKVKNKQQEEYNKKLANDVKNKTAQYKEQQQIAIKANIDKTRFIASASHDLRAPLNAIRWKLERKLTQDQDKQEIMEEIILLDKLVESIVNLSKFDANIIKPKISNFSLESFFTEAINRFKGLIKDKNITVSITIDPQITWVKSDQFLLSRMINNIIDNALKNMQSNGSLQIIATQETDSATIYIIDNGPGIPLHIKSRLYDSFVRGTEKYAGFGLGLTIVQQISKILNLRLKLNSCDYGTEFSFAIELADDVSSSTLDSQPKKIALVIDNDEYYAYELEQQLTNCGYLVTIITDMNIINNFSISEPIDLVVCDFNLGLEDNGLTLINSYQQKGTINSKQIIIISEDKTVKQQVSNYPDFYFLSKPIKFGRLSWILQRGS